MPVTLVMELLAVHEEIEKIKGEELERATKAIKDVPKPNF
tara:strand:+ start:541 stop:660 length:120 start_codon:yes stop_codon:yes gene_type:complete